MTGERPRTVAMSSTRSSVIPSRSRLVSRAKLKSWTRLRSDPRWAALNLEEWHLVTPWDPTPEADAWFQGLPDCSCTVYWHGLTYVDNLAAKYPEVIDYYLEGGKTCIEDAYQAVVALLSPADAGTALDIPNVSSRLAKALATLKGPHYRYELRFGEGELPGLVGRPNLMMTWIQSDGLGKTWQAVDVIARCAASPTERPIVISGTVSAEKDSDLATAIQDFRDFGTSGLLWRPPWARSPEPSTRPAGSAAL